MRRLMRPETYGPRCDYYVDLALSLAWLLGSLCVAGFGVLVANKPGYLLLASIGMIAAGSEAVFKIHRWTLHPDGRLDLYAILGCTTVLAEEVLDFKLQTYDDFPPSYLVKLSNHALRRPMRRSTGEALRDAIGGAPPNR
jgi:hypothetical protein